MNVFLMIDIWFSSRRTGSLYEWFTVVLQAYLGADTCVLYLGHIFDLKWLIYIYMSLYIYSIYIAIRK